MTGAKRLQMRICGGKPATKVGLKDDEPKRIVFIGCTGTGKSSLCTALTGQDKKNTTFKMGKGAKSETTASLAEELHWLGDTELPRFRCIDTPGLNDSEGQDEHHISDIIAKMKEMEYVSAIVLVINATEVRFSKSLQDVFGTFQEAFCGDGANGDENFYGNLIICFQRWKMDEDSIVNREDDEMSEESITTDINTQFRGKFQIGRKKDFPCVFVDSHDRTEARKKERLLKLQQVIPEDVFRTADLAQIVPRIHGYDSVEQSIVQGARVIAMKPVLIDPRVEVKTWVIYPQLPDGLQFCPERGHITGTPVKFCPARDHKLTASSHGGSSEAYILASFEVKISEQEVAEVTARHTEAYEGKIEAAIGSSDPTSEEELAQVMESIGKATKEFLAEAEVDFSVGDMAGMSQLPDIIKGLELAVGEIKTKCETDLQMKHKDYVSKDAARRLQLEKADNVVQRKLLECTEDYGELEASIISLEALSIENGSSEAETVSKAREWLGQIAMCKCTNSGCTQMLMHKDQVAHNKTCLFGLPLLPHSAVKKARGENFDEKVELVNISADEKAESWAGVYECGESNYPVKDDEANCYHMVNGGERRLQRIKKQEDDHWVVTAWIGPDEEEEVQFTSTNETDSFADANFEEFTKEAPCVYSWDAECTEKAELLEESVKMVYFTGMWCPYCPPFTAKLKKFFEIITEQFGSRALQVISVSSDQSEADMLEYYGGTQCTTCI